jgi:GPH family glycoside/pentoside/hexuronide:cation symporter
LTFIIDWSLIPDTVEYDYAQTGERREGIYYGIWTFASKVGQALATLLMGSILQLFHYVPNQTSQVHQTLLGIRLLFGPIPAVIFIIGAIIVLFYPISEQRYQEILNKRKEFNPTDSQGV